MRTPICPPDQMLRTGAVLAVLPSVTTARVRIYVRDQHTRQNNNVIIIVPGPAECVWHGMKGSGKRLCGDVDDDGDNVRKAMWRTSTFTALSKYTRIVYWRHLLPADGHKQCRACTRARVFVRLISCSVSHCSIVRCDASYVCRWAPCTCLYWSAYIAYASARSQLMMLYDDVVSRQFMLKQYSIYSMGLLEH